MLEHRVRSTPTERSQRILEAKVSKLKRSWIVFLLAISFVAYACDSKSSDAKATAQAEPSGPTKPGPTDKERQSEGPSDPDESDRASEADADSGIQMRRIHGVKALPPAHPCHDDTKVLVTGFTGESPATEENVSHTITTLGKKRASWEQEEHDDEACAHFEPRLVEGVGWSLKTGDHMVVACDMAGNDVRRFDCDQSCTDYDSHPVDIVTDDVEFEISHLRPCDTTGYSYSSIIELHRPAAESSWNVVSTDEVATGDDGENPPYAWSHAEVVDAAVTDNQEVTTTGYLVQACKPGEDACLDDNSEFEYDNRFGATLRLRKDDKTIESRLVVDCDGKIITETGPERAKSLTKELGAHRPALLKHLRAVVRDRCKE
jgi:hypothetical protein